MSLKIVLIEPLQMVRHGLRMILDQLPNAEVVAEFGYAEEGLHYIRAKRPDLVLMDVHMPRMSGLALTEKIVRSELPTRVIVLATSEDTRLPRRFLNAGAAGYLTKHSTSSELLQAIECVAGGQRFLSPDVAQSMAMSVLDSEKSPFETLSNRELEVAMMLVKGQGLVDIGHILSLSPKTVSTYKQRVLEKLRVPHVVEVAYMMMAYGLLDQHAQTMKYHRYEETIS